MRVCTWLIVAALALAGSGCARYYVYRPTQPGQAYVVRHQMLRADAFYSCDARNNSPVCYRIEEIERQ